MAAAMATATPARRPRRRPFGGGMIADPDGGICTAALGPLAGTDATPLDDDAAGATLPLPDDGATAAMLGSVTPEITAERPDSVSRFSRCNSTRMSEACW